MTPKYEATDSIPLDFVFEENSTGAYTAITLPYTANASLDGTGSKAIVKFSVQAEAVSGMTKNDPAEDTAGDPLTNIYMEAYSTNGTHAVYVIQGISTGAGRYEVIATYDATSASGVDPIKKTYRTYFDIVNPDA